MCVCVCRKRDFKEKRESKLLVVVGEEEGCVLIRIKTYEHNNNTTVHFLSYSRRREEINIARASKFGCQGAVKLRSSIAEVIGFGRFRITGTYGDIHDPKSLVCWTQA